MPYNQIYNKIREFNIMEKVDNKEITSTIYIDGVINLNPTITIATAPYLLEKYDFDKVLNGKNFLNELSTILVGTWIALLINMGAKFLGNQIDKKITFDRWEIYAFLISLITYIVFLIIDKCVPSERKRIIKSIKTHFNIK